MNPLVLARQFVRTPTFQVVFVPSLLAIVAIAAPTRWWAVIGSVAVALLAFVIWAVFQRRLARSGPTLAFEVAPEPVDVLIMAASLKGTTKARIQDRATKLVGHWQPTKVICLVTSQASIDQTPQWIRDAAADVKPKAEFMEADLIGDQHLDDPIRWTHRAADEVAALGLDEPSIVVDITGATKLASIGMYQYAIEAGARACYLAEGEKGASPSRVIVIAEDPKRPSTRASTPDRMAVPDETNTEVSL